MRGRKRIPQYDVRGRERIPGRAGRREGEKEREIEGEVGLT